MQKEILEKHPESDVRLYVVWFSMIPGDTRYGWDGCVMSDPRATHLWDEQRLASQAFAGSVEDAQEPVWDAFLLYGPDATWDDAPPTPISSGSTVYGERQVIRTNILPLLD